MPKKIMRYPATLSFRTTDKLKIQLERQAAQENKSVSEILQALLQKGLLEEETDYIILVMELARIRGWDKKRITNKIKLHRDEMADASSRDLYSLYKKQAIQDIKSEIEVAEEVAASQAAKQKIK